MLSMGKFHEEWSPYASMTGRILMTNYPANYMLETTADGVFLNPSGTRTHLINKDGNVTEAAQGVCAKTLAAAWDAWTEHRRKHPHAFEEPLCPGWSYVVEHDGRTYAVSCGKTKVYLERSPSKHIHNELRLRIDNKSPSDSKSAPVNVILRLLAKEAQRNMKVIPQ